MNKVFCTFPLYFCKGCLKLLDTLPETVYRVCDLLIVVTQRNGIEWQKRIMTSLVEEVSTHLLIHYLLFVCNLIHESP